MLLLLHGVDPKLKKDIIKKTSKEEDKALEMIKDIKNYSYRYKWDSDFAPKRIGLMATEAPEEIVTPDRRGIYLDKQISLLTMATKALAKKVERRAN